MLGHLDFGIQAICISMTVLGLTIVALPKGLFMATDNVMTPTGKLFLEIDKITANQGVVTVLFGWETVNIGRAHFHAILVSCKIRGAIRHHSRLLAVRTSVENFQEYLV